jgi:hypothetical protein
MEIPAVKPGTKRRSSSRSASDITTLAAVIATSASQLRSAKCLSSRTSRALNNVDNPRIATHWCKAWTITLKITKASEHSFRAHQPDGSGSDCRGPAEHLGAEVLGGCGGNPPSRGGPDLTLVPLGGIEKKCPYRSADRRRLGGREGRDLSRRPRYAPPSPAAASVAPGSRRSNPAIARSAVAIPPGDDQAETARDAGCDRLYKAGIAPSPVLHPPVTLLEARYGRGTRCCVPVSTSAFADRTVREGNNGWPPALSLRSLLPP